MIRNEVRYAIVERTHIPTIMA
ncbi:hypothetical protein SMALA_2958 [Streptomyces malaysiensis subsp. malaysiensis]|nr:hypothetical protein SMALA_2958 [Streptomyces malaysiensis]